MKGHVCTLSEAAGPLEGDFPLSKLNTLVTEGLVSVKRYFLADQRQRSGHLSDLHSSREVDKAHVPTTSQPHGASRGLRRGPWKSTGACLHPPTLNGPASKSQAAR